MAFRTNTLQWNPSIVDTLGTWRSVLYSKVSTFQGFIYSKRAYLGHRKCPYRGALISGTGTGACTHTHTHTHTHAPVSLTERLSHGFTAHWALGLLRKEGVVIDGHPSLCLVLVAGGQPLLGAAVVGGGAHRALGAAPGLLHSFVLSREECSLKCFLKLL